MSTQYCGSKPEIGFPTTEQTWVNYKLRSTDDPRWGGAGRIEEALEADADRPDLLRLERTFPASEAALVPGSLGKANERWDRGAHGRPQGRSGILDGIRRALERKVVVTENGRRQKMSVIEVVITQLANNAAKGDPRCIAIIAKLLPHLEKGADKGPSGLTLVIKD